jgi:PAS domain S-box-containing protein
MSHPSPASQAAPPAVPAQAGPPAPSAIPADVAGILQRAVEEAARLLEAEGAMIYLLEPNERVLRFAHDSGLADDRRRRWVRGLKLRVGQGMFGVAVGERRVVVTDDYQNDASFPHGAQTDRFVREVDLRSMVVAPLVTGNRVFGGLGTFSNRAAAFSPAQIALVRALADHAAAAMSNALLIDELAGSQAKIARSAEAERALRAIANRISSIHEPTEVIQMTVDEAARLLNADGARIDLIDPDIGLLRWAYQSGDDRPGEDVWPDDPDETLDQGVSGKAVTEGRVFFTGDYLADDRFDHGKGADTYIANVGVRSVMSAPLIGDSGSFGALTVYTSRIDAWTEDDAEVLGALGTEAAIAITNARLIDELRRTRAEMERGAESERSLREMAARIAELRDPDELLRQIVDEASRLLGSDGAHMTRMSDDATHLLPLVVAGGLDDATEAWLKRQRFPLHGGINGLAASLGRPIWTEDYALDPRIPHELGDVDTATRLGLRSMASVPLRSPDGSTIGTLAVSYQHPHVFQEDELAVLKTLADHAAIAITNTSLLERLSESESRYRHLVQNSPDLVWSIDADARFTFVSDTCERLTGWRPDELLGRHFGALVHSSSSDVAEVDWTAGLSQGRQEMRGRLSLLHKDGHPIPSEFSAMGELDADGRFIGATGSVRDMTDRERLEHELRESEERYRFLVQNSPDIVFQIDSEGRFTYLGETIERITGFTPDELIGQHFSVIVDPGSHAEAAARWTALVAEPGNTQVVQINLRHKAGSTVPVEVSAIGTLGPDGRFEGIHGATRDVTERERLARNLREQTAALAAGEERAHLARELHDSVTQALFSMTLLTRTTEMLLERDPGGAREKLGTLRDLQREALAEMRALIFELRPGNLEQDGLVRALKTHTAALQGRIGLPIVVTSDLEERLPIEIEDVVYRIAQEGLHNVVKHAGARQVRVEIERQPSGLRLRIVDDGRGFDPTRIPEGHLGLAGMRARAAKVGGELSIRSRPGSGSTVEVFVPVTAVDRNGSVPEAATAANEPAAIEEPASASAE